MGVGWDSALLPDPEAAPAADHFHIAAVATAPARAVRGGTAALAARLGVPQKNLWRNLKVWEKTEPPMVVVAHGPKSRNNPGLSSVQLPVVTELIV